MCVCVCVYEFGPVPNNYPHIHVRGTTYIQYMHIIRAEFGPAPQNLWSYSTASAEWRDHGVLMSSPPSLTYCSMASVSSGIINYSNVGNSSSTISSVAKEGVVWLFGGIPNDIERADSNAQSALLYKLSINPEDGVPIWTRVNLPQAPKSRFGANIGVVGPYIFQYSGAQVDVDNVSETSIRFDGSGDLHALCTFAEEFLIPKWIDLSYFDKEPMSRAHYASAVVGTSLWIHGGETTDAYADKRRALVGGDGKRRELQDSAHAHQLWLLATSPDALPKNVVCPRGYMRNPPPYGPCVDIGENSNCMLFV